MIDMKEEDVINNIAEIIWFHLYKDRKYTLSYAKEDEYFPVMFAAKEIYQRINPPHIKLEMKEYNDGIKPIFITPGEQILRNVIFNLEQKIEHYLLRIKQLENFFAKQREKIIKIFELFPRYNYIGISHFEGVGLYKKLPDCVNSVIVPEENNEMKNDIKYLGHDFDPDDFPIMLSKPFKSCATCRAYKNQSDCNVRLYCRKDFVREKNDKNT